MTGRLAEDLRHAGPGLDAVAGPREHHDGPASRQQPADDRAPDEARGARDEDHRDSRGATEDDCPRRTRERGPRAPRGRSAGSRSRTRRPDVSCFTTTSLMGSHSRAQPGSANRLDEDFTRL